MMMFGIYFLVLDFKQLLATGWLGDARNPYKSTR